MYRQYGKCNCRLSPFPLLLQEHDVKNESKQKIIVHGILFMLHPFAKFVTSRLPPFRFPVPGIGREVTTRKSIPFSIFQQLLI